MFRIRRRKRKERWSIIIIIFDFDFDFDFYFLGLVEWSVGRGLNNGKEEGFLHVDFGDDSGI